MERLIAHLGRESLLRAQWAAADRVVWAKAMTVPSGKVSRTWRLEGRVRKGHADDRRIPEIFWSWESLIMWFRLVLNSSSSWLSFMISGIPGLSHSTQLATWAISCMWMCACTYMHMCGFCCSTQHFLNYFSGNKSRTQYFLHHHFISCLSFPYTP